MNSTTNLQKAFAENVQKCLQIGAEIDILDYIEQNHRDEINHLLNELSGLDYRVLQIADIKVGLNSMFMRYVSGFKYVCILAYTPALQRSDQHSDRRRYAHRKSMWTDRSNHTQAETIFTHWPAVPSD